jgi:hypothetical protein
MPFNDFHLFPMLPAELRLKIWSHTFPTGRIIEIVWSERKQNWYCIQTSRNTPNHAHVANKEAHVEFMKLWFPLAPEEDQGRSHSPTASRLFRGHHMIYFNPEIDTLYIGGAPRGDDPFAPMASEKLLSIPVLQHLRFLAVEISEWYSLGLNESPITKEMDILSRFPNLELFTIADYDIDWVHIHEGKKRPPGVLEFVESTQLRDDVSEMAPHMIKRLDEHRKKNPGIKVPLVVVKEVTRGGILMTYQ